MKYARSEAKNWVKDTLRGYIVTTTTPFKPDLEVDYDALRRNVEMLLALPGTQGLYLGSVYQEFWTMTLDERKRVTDAILEANAGRVPVIGSVTHNSFKDSIDLAKHAQSSGTDLVMCWPPFFGPRSSDGVVSYYKRVADATDIGIVVYSSALSEIGYYITPEDMVRLAEIDTVVGAKEASLSLDKYSAMLAAAGHLLPISCPLEEYHLYGLAAFGPEIMPRFIFGSSRPIYMQTRDKPYCVEFWAAVEAGDFEGARRPLQKILRIANQLHSRYLSKGQHNVALTKHIMGMFGMIPGTVRPPLTPPPQEEVELAKQVLRAEGLLP
jgi:4-hydroxy-tetrahydrodipicolinate synthase